MARKNAAHDMVMESLTGALLQLMKHKPLSDINILELCERAGVSRVSFYRNFDSIQDILVKYLSKCTDDWWREFSTKTESDFYRFFWVELLGQYKKNGELITLLYESGASNILKEHIFSCCDLHPERNDMDAYSRAVLAGAIYGLVDEWIRRGMKEFPRDFSIHNIALTIPITKETSL